MPSVRQRSSIRGLYSEVLASHFSVEAFVPNACLFKFGRLAKALLQLGRFEVLIHTEKIIRIVFAFNRDQPLVITAVSFFHAFFSFISHQELYVCATRSVLVQRTVNLFCTR